MRFLKKWIFLLLLLLSSTSLFSHYDYELAACAVFKDEGPYLREWVLFHRAQGVQRFYLYNLNSCDNWYSELQDLICAGIVEIIPWPYDFCDCKSYDILRCKAYMHCIHRIKNCVRWCAFLDCNEFLFSPTPLPIEYFLRKLKKYACLSINIQVYGTSNIEFAPCYALIRYLLWKCHPKHECCKVSRCIVQPKFVIGCKCPGEFIFTPGSECVNPNKEKIKKKKHKIVIDKIRINQYIFRDLYFYRNCFNRIRCSFPFDIECIDFNLVYDDCILRVCHPL